MSTGTNIDWAFNKHAIAGIFAAVAVLAASMQAAAQTKSPPPVAPSVANAAPAPAVAEAADRVLKQMGAYIGSAERFTFHADITFDHVLPSGQKLQFSATEDVALQRPNELYVEWSSDLGNRQLWYDGKNVTIYDTDTSFHGTEAAPPAIDGALDKLINQLNFTPPLVDFFYSDPYKNMRGTAQFGFSTGETQINGRTCRGLAFVDKHIDWQIWVDTGPQLVPCKLVITYKNNSSMPQFSAVYSETRMSFIPRVMIMKKLTAGALGFAALATLLAATSEQVSARFGGGFGGFHGGGFGGGGFRGGGFGGGGFHTFGGGGFGGARFGDGGFMDRGGDAGFGRGGFGSIRNSGNFADRDNAFRSSHPEFGGDAKQLQQNRFNEANTLQANRITEANTLQFNHQDNWNYWGGHWGGYYAGLGLGAGFAIGATVAALPAAAAAISVANAQYWYASGVYYAMQNGQYVVVPPPQGAVVTTAPPSCSVVYVGTSSRLDCGGAYYEQVPAGYKVIPPPVGATVTSLPDGAVAETIKGTAYFHFGGAYYRPFYSGSSVIYEVVAKPA